MFKHVTLARTVLIAGFLAVSTAAAATSGQAASSRKDSKATASSPSRTTSPSVSHTSLDPRRMTLIRRRWGIDVMGVHLTSAGYMLEFRYRVLDPKKAARIFDRKIKPTLVDSATGAKVVVPSPEKVGQLRNVYGPEAGRVYWMLFANPGKIVRRGSRVSINAGEFQVNDLVVD